jgi:hypothetical protein
MFTRRNVPRAGARIKHHPAIEAGLKGDTPKLEDAITG